MDISTIEELNERDKINFACTLKRPVDIATGSLHDCFHVEKGQCIGVLKKENQGRAVYQKNILWQEQITQYN